MSNTDITLPPCPRCGGEVTREGASADQGWQCQGCQAMYKRIAHCDKCDAELERLQACGAVSYFCNSSSCNELKSKRSVRYAWKEL